MSACTVCGVRACARGLCHRHYSQVRRHGRILTDAEIRESRAARGRIGGRVSRGSRSTAAALAARRAATDARIEDLEWLIQGGTPVDEALQRVGWTPGAAEKALDRRGHQLREAVRPLAYAARNARRRAA